MDKVINSKTIAIRCGVDFGIGLSRGVPFLLDLFDEKKVSATFFVTMGPDGFGKNIERAKEVGYWSRIKRMKFSSMLKGFGPKYICKQLFGIGGHVGADNPFVLKEIVNRGHELGIHGWDHFWWAENVWSSPLEQLLNDTLSAVNYFESYLSFRPKSSAAPNWRTSIEYLSAIDSFGFSYLADTRGKFPYFPSIEGKQARTLQVPFNLPCLHEIPGYLKGKSDDEIIEEFLKHLDSEFNIWCIHDYYEGILKRELFTQIIDKLEDMGYRLVTIQTLIESIDPKSFKISQIEKRVLPGGRGYVSHQV